LLDSTRLFAGFHGPVPKGDGAHLQQVQEFRGLRFTGFCHPRLVRHNETTWRKSSSMCTCKLKIHAVSSTEALVISDSKVMIGNPVSRCRNYSRTGNREGHIRDSMPTKIDSRIVNASLFD
jgi:hypothetical protein